MLPARLGEIFLPENDYGLVSQMSSGLWKALRLIQILIWGKHARDCGAKIKNVLLVCLAFWLKI